MQFAKVQDTVMLMVACICIAFSCNQKRDKSAPEQTIGSFPKKERPARTDSIPLVRNLSSDSGKVNFTDTKGLKQGLWKEYYKNGSIKTECHYLNGVLDGIYTSYYSNGNKHVEQLFKNGKHWDYSKSYFPNGQLRDLAQRNEGAMQKFEIYDKQGNMVYHEIYQNGKVVIEGDDTIMGYKKE
jgi:hypothetical protein